MIEDLYKILDIDRNASQEDIKKAYRKMAMKYHPDRNPGDKNAENMFKKVANAYSILSDKDKKYRYDNYGDIDENNINMNMDDIFSQFSDLFGSGFGFGFGGFGRNNNTSFKQKGSDIKITLKVDMNDIINGVKKKIHYDRDVVCDDCNGVGGSGVEECPTCNGTGRKVEVTRTPFGVTQQISTCTDCQGSGKRIKHRCHKCCGSGVVKEKNMIDVNIPQGVSDGNVFKMCGYGNFSKDNIPGDLYIFISEIKTDKWIRKDNDIYMKKDITVIDAILGKKSVEIDTPYGKMCINIEKGTHDGIDIIVKGKGIKNGSNLGDLHVIPVIKIPKSVTKEEKDILEKLRKSKNFKI